MNITDGDPESNRRTLLGLISSGHGINLYLAPELWTSGYLHDSWGRISLEDTPKTLAWLANECRHRSIWVGGSLIARNGVGNIVNRFFMVNPLGHVSTLYDKSHLFRPMKEHLYLEAGRDPPEVRQLNNFSFAPAICYDLRFPEMFRSLAIRGVSLYLVSAEWPASRHGALRTLAEARALENQAFLILSNRTGQDSFGEVFAGRSAIFGPLGLICEGNSDVGLVVANLEERDVSKARSDSPVLMHRVKGIDY